MAGSQEFEEQARLPEYELPPAIPRKPAFNYSVESDPIWDTDRAEERLISTFKERKHALGIEGLIDFVSPSLLQRWQLGYTPRLSHYPGGVVNVEFPATSTMALNNRKRHSIEVANVAVDLGGRLGIEEDALYLLAVGGILHDFGHIGFSHIGDAFVRHLAVVDPNGGKYKEALDANSLNVSHEDRTKLQIEDPESELSGVLRDIGIDGEKKDMLLEILGEDGIGFLLSFADTTAYLDLDSLFYGYTPPLFGGHIGDILTIVGDSIRVKNDRRSREVLSNFAQYRNAMYKDEYFHPFTKAVIATQALAFETHFNNLPNEQTRTRFLRDLTVLSDEQLLENLRKRTLMERAIFGATFFGIPLSGVRELKPGEQVAIGQITADSNGNGRPKIMRFTTDDGGEMEVDIDKVAQDFRSNSPFPPDTKLTFFQNGTFFKTFEPLFARFCSLSRSVHEKPLTLRDFQEAYARKSLFESPDFVRKMMELAGIDMAVSYRLRDAVDLSGLSRPDFSQDPTFQAGL